LSRRADSESFLQRYLSEIRAYSVLTREQEREIALAAERCGDKADLNKLIESNLSFVLKIANEHRNMGLPLEDLVCEGNIGLIEAARRFDHTKGTKFITYAVWWVRKAMLDALYRQSSLIRVPLYRLKKAKKIRETEASLSRELGRPPDRDEISSKLECTISKLDEALMIKPVELSLDDDTGREGIPIRNYLVDHDSVNPEQELLKSEGVELLRLAVRLLTEQEKTVIVKRFGMQRGRSLTLKEIGETMGLTRERIRQIETQAKKKLRRIVEYISSPPRGPMPSEPITPLTVACSPVSRRLRERRAPRTSSAPPDPEVTPAESPPQGA
jgi:RNA polymerase primary sigma factor